MKRILFIFLLTGLLNSCQNSTEGSTKDANSITPPPTADTTSTIAPMMGDTSKTEVDSLKK